jgi:hypothetical protein
MNWSATLAGEHADLHAERRGLPADWDLVRVDPRSDEELCETTHGAWNDDDPDPNTGLFCECPNDTDFVPAAGGCVMTTH